MKWKDLPEDDKELKKLFEVDHRKDYRIQPVECCLTCDHLKTGPDGSIECDVHIEIKNFAYYKYYGHTEEEAKEYMDFEFKYEKDKQQRSEFTDHLGICDIYKPSNKIGGMGQEQDLLMKLKGE